MNHSIRLSVPHSPNAITIVRYDGEFCPFLPDYAKIDNGEFECKHLIRSYSELRNGQMMEIQDVSFVYRRNGDTRYYVMICATYRNQYDKLRVIHRTTDKLHVFESNYDAHKYLRAVEKLYGHSTPVMSTL